MSSPDLGVFTPEEVINTYKRAGGCEKTSVWLPFSAACIHRIISNIAPEVMNSQGRPAKVEPLRDKIRAAAASGRYPTRKALAIAFNVSESTVHRALRG